MAWWIWILAGFALLAIEFTSTTMHIGFFAFGAFLVGALVGFGWQSELWVQLIVFTITSLIALLIFRPMIVRKLRMGADRPPVDAIHGETAVALDEIASGKIGKAELRGSTWSALNVGSGSVTKGQRCTVERVDGLTLHIKP